jgi:hypothetical protein
MITDATAKIARVVEQEEKYRAAHAVHPSAPRSCE